MVRIETPAPVTDTVPSPQQDSDSVSDVGNDDGTGEIVIQV